MKLVIISPQNRYEYDVEWIEAFTPSGSLIIQQGHVPIILTLVAGLDLSFVLSVTGEKKIVKLVRPGFMEVDRMSVRALIGQETYV